MLEEAALDDGWRVWNAEDHHAVLAYRPDVFDAAEFPAACLPTIYVTRGRRTRRPEGPRNLPPDAPWVVTLFLEPEVNSDAQLFDSRADAVEAAAELSRAFADGEVDYRGLYQVPRETYFEKLDELTGRG